MPFVGFTTKADQAKRHREFAASPSLYMVTRKPRHHVRDIYRPIYWFTHAPSRAAAVRKAVELLPTAFGSDARYAKPGAELVVPGGPAKGL